MACLVLFSGFKRLHFIGIFVFDALPPNVFEDRRNQEYQ